MTDVYIGIGSNLHNPEQQVQLALQALARVSETHLLAHSRLYRSAPMGPAGQPDYVNAVAALATRLPALELLSALHGIEQAQGRVRDGSRWGPRTLDLDILLFGDESINQPRLQVPHPGLHERNFVLYPLQEIAPDLIIPGRGTLVELLAQCPPTGLELVDAV
jgi:2-amino-4-hydroxy-6-hydroxymethyldihydropteridine diphosphokinase